MDPKKEDPVLQSRLPTRHLGVRLPIPSGGPAGDPNRIASASGSAGSERDSGLLTKIRSGTRRRAATDRRTPARGATGNQGELSPGGTRLHPPTAVGIREPRIKAGEGPEDGETELADWTNPVRRLPTREDPPALDAGPVGGVSRGPRRRKGVRMHGNASFRRWTSHALRGRFPDRPQGHSFEEQDSFPDP